MAQEIVDGRGAISYHAANLFMRNTARVSEHVGNELDIFTCPMFRDKQKGVTVALKNKVQHLQGARAQRKSHKVFIEEDVLRLFASSGL